MNNYFDCVSCYWFYSDGTCDSCAYGYPYATDNNGLKPEEVKVCNIYIKDEKVSREEKSTEEMIQEKGLDAPRLTPELIDETIVDEAYYVFPGTTTTICRLTLKNGFSTIGESAAVSLENFDEAIGRKVARENARDKIWMLEGYLLKDKLYRGNLTS